MATNGTKVEDDTIPTEGVIIDAENEFHIEKEAALVSKVTTNIETTENTMATRSRKQTTKRARISNRSSKQTLQSHMQ